MMDELFLPDGLVWIGFDEAGRSIAASIEKRKPTMGSRSIFAGCAAVVKCKWPSDGGIFGRIMSDFDAAP